MTFQQKVLAEGGRGLSAGVAEMQAPPFEFLRVVRSHVRELPEDVQVGSISCKNTQEEALVPIVLLCLALILPTHGDHGASGHFHLELLTFIYPDERGSSTRDTETEPSSFSLALPQRVLVWLSILC